MNEENIQGSTPQEKWEALKKYILEQIDFIDSEVTLEPNDWYHEMRTINSLVKQYNFKP